MTPWIASSTSGGTSSMPWASRAWVWISSNSCCSSSFRATHWQPGTTSPHLNCFTRRLLAVVSRRSLAAGGPLPAAAAASASSLRARLEWRMCRILAYLGEPLPAQALLFDTDNGLVRQSYSPRMMNTFLNLAGFGMKAWDPTSLRPDDPFSYRATTLPSFDRNLRFLSSKVAPTCVVAHVRGVTYSDEAVVAETNL